MVHFVKSIVGVILQHAVINFLVAIVNAVHVAPSLVHVMLQVDHVILTCVEFVALPFLQI
jgi:hypothetical protein